MPGTYANSLKDVYDCPHVADEATEAQSQQLMGPWSAWEVALRPESPCP